MSLNDVYNKALLIKPDKKDRKMFDEMLSYSSLYNPACSMPCRPIVIHPVFVSIMFEHYNQLIKIGIVEFGD